MRLLGSLVFKKIIRILEGASSRSHHHKSISASQLGGQPWVCGQQNDSPGVSVPQALDPGHPLRYMAKGMTCKWG